MNPYHKATQILVVDHPGLGLHAKPPSRPDLSSCRRAAFPEMLLGGLRALFARISVIATLAQSTPFWRSFAMNVCGGLLTVCCTLGGPIVEQHAR